MNTELKEAINLVKKAGKEVLNIYRTSFKIQQKEDESPVTEADITSEKIILSGLKKYNYGVLSEESRDDYNRLKKKKVWIIDPLDGTQDFLKKTGEFSIMVGLVDNKEPILGVVYEPIADKLYFAEKEKGAFVKESDKPLKKLEVSSVSCLSDSCFVVSRFHLIELEKRFIAKNKIKKVTYVGSAGIKIGLIAEGKADGYINLSQKTCQWDTCAPEIILKEAGGEITNLKGENFSYNSKELRNLNGIVASNKKIHSQIIKQINQLLSN